MRRAIVSYKGAFLFSVAVTAAANFGLLYLMTFLQKGEEVVGATKQKYSLTDIQLTTTRPPRPLRPEVRRAPRKPKRKRESAPEKLRPAPPQPARKRTVRPRPLTLQQPVPRFDANSLLPLDFDRLVALQEDRAPAPDAKDTQASEADTQQEAAPQGPDLSAPEGLYKLGDVDQKPVLLHSVKPLYPLSARRLGLTGYVQLELIVTASGDVTDVEVMDSAGLRSFERSAVQAIRQWKFKPATLRGVPVAVRCRKRITFRLKDANG